MGTTCSLTHSVPSVIGKKFWLCPIICAPIFDIDQSERPKENLTSKPSAPLNQSEVISKLQNDEKIMEKGKLWSLLTLRYDGHKQTFISGELNHSGAPQWASNAIWSELFIKLLFCSCSCDFDDWQFPTELLVELLDKSRSVKKKAPPNSRCERLHKKFKKKKYPQHHNQKVTNITQPNHPTPQPSHPQNTRQSQQWVTESNIKLLCNNNKW